MRQLSPASSPSSMTGRVPPRGVVHRRAPAHRRGQAAQAGTAGTILGRSGKTGQLTPGEAEPREMSHPVIPAPARFDSTEGRFALRPGTTIGYAASAASAAPVVAALVERFCSEVARRTGLRLVPLAGDAGPGE